MTISGWSETPFRLASANMRAGVPASPSCESICDINSDFPETLLAPFRTQLQYRRALPWTCFVVALMAAPLGISFSRAAGSSRASPLAIGLVFTMNFLTHLFLALGEGDRVSPIAAAWTPNMIFLSHRPAISRLRATNRETPSFNPVALWRNVRAT